MLALTDVELDAFADPVLFQERVLGRQLWGRQKEIAYSVDNNWLTAIKGCHGSGKTFVVAGLVLNWLIKHKRGRVFTTAPTLRQVKSFWKDVYMAWQESPVARMLLPEPTTTGLEVSKENYAFGASSSKGVNVQGFHGEDVLIVGDEAPGIDTEIWDAIQGIRMAGNVHMVILGNPVVPVGQFFDAFGKERAQWNLISISALDTPNMTDEFTGQQLTLEQLIELPENRLDYSPYKSLTTRRGVVDRYLSWGPNHPKFRSRVMAEFPSQSPNSVFDLAWIERAKRDPTERELEKAKICKIQVGIDVAGPGDDETALCARVGGIILEQHAWNMADPIGPVMEVLYKLKRHPLYDLGVVVVDITGIGYHFAPRIAEGGYQVYGFNASQRAVDAEQYSNGKSEAYFTTREYFKYNDVSNLQDEECEAQLTTMQYRETSRGRTEILHKDEMRKLGVPSPDRAEALILSFCRVVPREIRMVMGGEGTEEFYKISDI